MTDRRSTGGLARVIGFMAAAVIMVALAAAIPLFGTAGAGLALSVALAIAALVVAQASRAPGDWLFGTVMLMPFVLGLLFKISGIQLFGLWQAPVMVLALVGLPTFRNALSEDPFLRLFLFAFTLFLLWGLLASVAGRTRPLAGVYQFASNLKPLLAVILGFAILWTPRVASILRFFVHWTWLPAIILVAVEWVAPGLYFSIMPGTGSARGSIDPTGLLPSRASGFFEHPSFLAAMAAFLAIVSAAHFLHPTAAAEAKTRYAALTTVYLLLIIAAVQRQELAAAVLAILVMYVLARRAYHVRAMLLSLVFALFAASVFWLVYSGNILDELRMWGIGTLRMVEHPRAQIFQGAWHVAIDHFPLGAGFGTYGGAGAEKFDESLYRELGFGRYWWFGRENYLLDTYWPNSLGETGFVGAALLMLAYLALLVYGARKSIAESMPVGARLYWAVAASGMVYMLLLSFTSPAFQDPRLFVWPALLFGIGYGAQQRS